MRAGFRLFRGKLLFIFTVLVRRHITKFVFCNEVYYYNSLFRSQLVNS
eukprot:UN03320